MALVVTPGMDITAPALPASVRLPLRRRAAPRAHLADHRGRAQKTPEIVLGESLADFMRQLGMTPTAVATGASKTRCSRLFRSPITVTYDDAERSAGARMGVAEQLEPLVVTSGSTPLNRACCRRWCVFQASSSVKPPNAPFRCRSTL